MLWRSVSVMRERKGEGGGVIRPGDGVWLVCCVMVLSTD